MIIRILLLSLISAAFLTGAGVWCTMPMTDVVRGESMHPLPGLELVKKDI